MASGRPRQSWRNHSTRTKVARPVCWTRSRTELRRLRLATPMALSAKSSTARARSSVSKVPLCPRLRAGSFCACGLAGGTTSRGHSLPKQLFLSPPRPAAPLQRFAPSSLRNRHGAAEWDVGNWCSCCKARRGEARLSAPKVAVRRLTAAVDGLIINMWPRMQNTQLKQRSTV